MRTAPCGHPNEDHARFCATCGRALVAAAPSDPLIGATIAGRYRVTHVIGEGGMGRVYAASQQLGAASRHVAIKVMTSGHENAQAVARFRRECETVATLTHPSTIRCYDFGTLDLPRPDGRLDARLYIAMEYVEGRTLARAIADGPVPWDVAIRWLRQIGGAIAEAHRRGVVHRDLKPENVLLTRDEGDGELAKVLDFGIARAAGGRSDITEAGALVGTPAYMSPEQFLGRDVDGRADLYALGLIAFELLTGARAFVASTPAQWANAHLHGTPRDLDAFPSTRALDPPRRAALLSALEKEPSDRPSSVRAWLDALDPAGASGARSSAGMTHAGPRATEGPYAPTLDALPTARPRGVRRALAIGALAGGITAAAWLSIRAAPPPAAPTPPPPEAEAPEDAGPPPPPEPRWLRVLQYEDRATDATAALGPPDGRCARLGPRGTITLELSPDTRMETDGTPAADLVVRLADDRPSGPYRVDVGVERHRFRTIAAGLVGSAELDVDQHSHDRFRYVRIKNREDRGTVCVDAVGTRVEPPAAP